MVSFSATLLDPPEGLLSAARLQRDLASTARKGSATDPSALYSAAWSAILLSVAAMEAFLNREAERLLAKNSGLSDGDKRSLQEVKRLSLRQKLETWTPIVTGQQFNPNGDILCRVDALTNHRHAIMHVKHDRASSLSSASSDVAAADAVDCAVVVLLEWYRCAGKPAPSWVKM